MKKPKQPDFASRLVVLREAAGLTRYRLAQLAGLNRQYVGDLEAGRKSPGLDVVRKLTAALGQDSLACWD